MKLLKIGNWVLLITSLIILDFCNNSKHNISSNQAIKNLIAFTKLYGYVRFFHPSDQASQIDWDRFAIYGSEKVLKAGTSDELKTILKELFLPIGPAVQIYSEGESPEPPEIIDNTDSLEILAWQHVGVGLGSPQEFYSIYKSIRINRDNQVNTGRMEFGAVTQSVDATSYRGNEIKLRAFIRSNVSGSDNYGQLWIGIDTEKTQEKFFSKQNDPPVKIDEWQAYEINCQVPEDATRIVIGCILHGIGQIWVDDCKLSFRNDQNNWESIQINNPGFERMDDYARPTMWSADRPGYAYYITDEVKTEGEKSLRIESFLENFRGMLFDKYPKIGEVINKELGADLYCQVPLGLHVDNHEKVSDKNKSELDSLLNQLENINIDQLKADNEYVRIGNIVITWNVFQHFYPYWDVVNVDWDEELTVFLEEVMTNRNEEDFYHTLRKLVASIKDGHGNVYHRLSIKQAGFDFQVDWIESQVVITYVKDTTIFKVGDIILSVDDITSDQILLKEEAFISGSEQWKRFKSLNRFGYGEEGTIAKIEISRNGEIIELEASRKNKSQISKPGGTIDKIREDIYYINLDIVGMAEINEIMNDLAISKGVIFDLRGYPKGNHEVINHLLLQADTSGAWMRIPQYIYPDQENIVGFQNFGWHLQPKQPHISGEIVFITDGRAISYAESFMGFIEHYKLAEIVGQPTAGTNGNVNFFNLPGRFRITWTGMKVVKHDGSQLHLIGIQPTVPVQRTLKGVREGRDEFLEKAIEIIETKTM